MGAGTAGGVAPIAPVRTRSWGSHGRITAAGITVVGITVVGITVTGLAVPPAGASTCRKHTAEPPGPSGSFGNRTSCVWLFGLVLPPDAPEATGSGGTSPRCSPALEDFGMSHGAGTQICHLSTMDAQGEHRKCAAGVVGLLLACDDVIFQCTLYLTWPSHGVIGDPGELVSLSPGGAHVCEASATASVDSIHPNGASTPGRVLAEFFLLRCSPHPWIRAGLQGDTCPSTATSQMSGSCVSPPHPSRVLPVPPPCCRYLGKQLPRSRGTCWDEI